MKPTWLTIPGLLALTAIMATLAIREQRLEPPRPAISTVLPLPPRPEKTNAPKNHLTPAPANAEADPETIRVVPAVYQINPRTPATRPIEFQVAWLDYLRALEYFATPSPPELRQKRLLA